MSTPTATATITSISYLEHTEIPSTTPLGENYMERSLVDSIIVTVSVGDIVDHPIYFRPEALGNRIARYGRVSVVQEAVEAVVREMVFSWLPDLLPTDPTNREDVNGGVDTRIAVVWARGVPATAKLLLQNHAERVAAAVVAFSPSVIEDPPPIEEPGTIP